jgi:hypothetical protein
MGIKSVGQKDGGKKMVKIGKRWFKLGIRTSSMALLTASRNLFCYTDGLSLLYIKLLC